MAIADSRGTEHVLEQLREEKQLEEGKLYSCDSNGHFSLLEDCPYGIVHSIFWSNNAVITPPKVSLPSKTRKGTIAVEILQNELSNNQIQDLVNLISQGHYMYLLLPHLSRMLGQILYADSTIEVDLERFKLYEPIYQTATSFTLNVQYLNQFFGTEVTQIFTSAMRCVCDNASKLSQPLQNLLREWQSLTQSLVASTEQLSTTDMITVVFPFPTVRTRRRKIDKQRLLSTPELIERFQYSALTETKFYYNQTVFRPEELLQTQLAGRRTDPQCWDQLQGRLCDLRESLQAPETGQNTALLQQLRTDALSLKTEIKDTLSLNMTHQANMVRKVNLLIKRIFYLQHALEVSIPLESNTATDVVDKIATLYKFFKRVQTMTPILPEAAQSQSSAGKTQKAQTCIFNSND